MILIRNLTKTVNYEPLFQNLNLTIQAGDRIGIVGPNGVGKSTLLKIIVQLGMPDSGEVILEKERVGYLEQVIDPTKLGDSVQNYLGHASQHLVDKVLSEVGLSLPNTEQPLKHLSGGQKTKLCLAQVLLQRPTTLLLDEPTNHLDSQGLEVLENIVTQFRGAVLVVSHDRAFLNKCVNKIIEFDPQTKNIHEYPGNYDAYVTKRAIRQARALDLYKVYDHKKQRMESKLKEMQILAARDQLDGKVLRAWKNRMERELYTTEIQKPQDHKSLPKLNFEGKAYSGKLLVKMLNVTKSYESLQLLKDVSFEIRGAEHLLLKGANGSGKTTITKLILGSLQPDSGSVQLGTNVRVGYFDQEHSTLNPKNTLEQEVLATLKEKLHTQNIRSFLARFGFFDADLYKRIAQLSSGEQVRLMLAKLVHSEVDLLILDEPTNHLDITSREIIELALKEYQGAILVISHDRYFLNALGIDRTLTIEDQNIKATLS